jgi:hypothetical protein
MLDIIIIRLYINKIFKKIENFTYKLFRNVFIINPQVFISIRKEIIHIHKEMW